VFLTLCLVWAPAGLGLLRAQRRVTRGRVAIGLGAVVFLAVVLGRAQEVQYFNNHYTEVDHFLQDGGPKKAYRFARNQHDKRIGIAGSGEIFFGQYGFYGKSLDNYVQYIGVPGENGSYRLATTCPGFIKQINDGKYDYLILSQFTMDAPGPYQEPVYAWVKDDPALKLVIEETDVEPQPDYVFKVNGRLNPANCSNSG
jgi:hypothetical protein